MIEIVTGSDYWETITFTWSAITYPLTWDGLTSFSEISSVTTSYSESLTTTTTFTEV